MASKKKNNDSIDIRKINIDKKNVVKNNKATSKKQPVKKTVKNSKVEQLKKIEPIKEEKNTEIPKLHKKKSKKNILILIIIIISLIISISFNIFYINKKEPVKTVVKYKYKYKVDENIVFFGDSITSVYDVDHFYPNNHVVNSGVSGDKSENLVNRIDEGLYKYNPSKVFILIGINDLNHNISNKDILKNIQKIINGIKLNRKNSKIYVESIYPINQDLLKENEYSFNEEVTNEVILNLNKEIENLCNKNNIEYIDIYSMLLDDNGNLNSEYTKEGLHLNELGYMKLTEKLEKYVNM